MPTSLDDILPYFHSQFQSTYTIPYDLEKQFFFNGLSDFELDLYSLNFDIVSNNFPTTLSSVEKSLLGKLMYKYYITRELDRILKLNNIIGRDISLNGMGDSKREMQKRYESINGEIDSMMSKMKKGSYYD